MVMRWLLSRAAGRRLARPVRFRPRCPPGRRGRPPGSFCTSAGVPSAIRRPKSSTVTASASRITTPMSCSTSTIEMPRLSRTPAITAAVRRRSSAVMPATGSSRSSSAGLHAQGAAELDELLLPVREGARRAAEVGGETDELGDLADAFPVPALLAGRGGQPEPGGEEAGAGEPVAAEQQAVRDRGVRAAARGSGRCGRRPGRRCGAGQAGELVARRSGRCRRWRGRRRTGR